MQWLASHTQSKERDYFGQFQRMEYSILLEKRCSNSVITEETAVILKCDIFLSTIVKLTDGYQRVKTTLVVKCVTTTDLHSRMQTFWNAQANVATLKGRDLFCVDLTIGIALFPISIREDRSEKVTTSAGNELPDEILLRPKSVVSMPDSLEIPHMHVEVQKRDTHMPIELPVKRDDREEFCLPYQVQLTFHQDGMCGSNNTLLQRHDDLSQRAHCTLRTCVSKTYPEWDGCKCTKEVLCREHGSGSVVCVQNIFYEVALAIEMT